MNAVDMTIIGIILLACLYGYQKGFVNQAVGLLGLVVSLGVAYTFSQDTAAFLEQQFPLPQDTFPPYLYFFADLFSLGSLIYLMLSFIILFFVTRYLWKKIGSFLHAAVQFPVLNFVNRWLGAGLGMIQALILLTIAIHLTTSLPNSTWQAVVEDSKVAVLIQEYSSFIPKWRDIQLPEQKKERMNDPSVL
jgi:uncharacterized membrane protein required for colicin V production